MNNVLVTIAPATDAFTNVYCPACRAAMAMTSSVRFPSVAFSRPPTESPVFGDGFRRMTQQNRQRQNCEHRKNEMQRVRFMVEFLCCQRNWDKHEQPKQWVATDFLKEQLHGKAIFHFLHKRLQRRIGLKSHGLLGTESITKSNGSTHSDRSLRSHQTPPVASEDEPCPRVALGRCFAFGG